MSGITQSSVPVRQRLVQVDRRARIIALCAITAMAVALIALALALNGDFSSGGTQESAAPATQASPEPGVRYDGGPEEGTRGAARSSISPSVDEPFDSVGSGTSRYDGGPDEGTRGPNR